MEKSKNDELVELIGQLLDQKFGAVINCLKFEGPSGPISSVRFTGQTELGGVFFGEVKLSEDAFQIIDEITMHIGGKYGKFSYCPESDPPFLSE
jgi:hypothetical protein